MAEQKTYRHRLTGVVAEYPPALAEQFPDDLEEVEPGTKPLAYTPIDPAAVADYLASQEERDTDADEDADADETADAPTISRNKETKA